MAATVAPGVMIPNKASFAGNCCCSSLNQNSCVVANLLPGRRRSRVSNAREDASSSDGAERAQNGVLVSRRWAALVLPAAATLSSVPFPDNKAIAGDVTRRDVENGEGRVQLRTLNGVARYPDFVYNAEGGGGGSGQAEQLTDERTHVRFDTDRLHIPAVCFETTTILGLPLPPGLKIEVAPKTLDGYVEQNTGKMELNFLGNFYFTAGPIYSQPPLMVDTRLTTESAQGFFRGGKGQRKNVKQLWLDFFLYPSQWWDHRLEKGNARYPDFKHKQTQEGLWLGNKSNPSWVEAAVAAMAPGALQSNIYSWNKRLARFVKAGQYPKAIELFQQMQAEGLNPDKYSFVQVLNAYASLGSLEEGRRIHVQIIQNGLDSDKFVCNSLIDMYAKCGKIEDASRVFNEMAERDVVSWNSLILGHVKCGQGQKALELYEWMQREKVEPVSVTFVGLLNACASVAALKEGRHIHERIIERGIESDVFVSSCLVDMYAKCGSIVDAERVFNKMPIRSVVAWTAMILGLVKSGQRQKALDLSRMMQQEGVQPDAGAFVGMLNACASVGALEEGRHVHEQVIQKGFECDVFVGSCLIDMYAKCGSIEDAQRVFNKMPIRNVVAWTAMILGLVKCGQGQKALELSQTMQQEGVEPDAVTFVSMLNACASVGALEEGRLVHRQIIKKGFESDVFVGSGLIDMYAKCGSIEDAQRVFNEMPVHNLVACTAMLGGYAMHGYAEQALEHFQQMCQAGMKPDGVTFVSLLSACSHGGLVDEGLNHFESMSLVYGISAEVEHYACIVDLLGRAGHLQEAENMIRMMSCELDATLWMSLAGACRLHGNMEMGVRAAEKLLDLEPENAGAYVLLANIYAAAGKWDSSAAIHQERLERCISKQPGRTWIEVNRKVHTFIQDDREHPQIKEIHGELTRLCGLMIEAGYKPDTSFALHNVEEEHKMIQLSRHSEKLAIAFGLISTPHRTPLYIFKNLRVCGDCHFATKLIGKITGRAIIVRDANRFHHFHDGHCSCNDYW